MNEELTEERDQLLTTAERLREKLNEATKHRQDIEAQREMALENISQVNVQKILFTENERLNIFLLLFYDTKPVADIVNTEGFIIILWPHNKTAAAVGMFRYEMQFAAVSTFSSNRSSGCDRMRFPGRRG